MMASMPGGFDPCLRGTYSGACAGKEIRNLVRFRSLVLAGFLAGCSAAPRAPLDSLFPHALTGPLAAPDHPLRDPLSTPFFAGGWTVRPEKSEDDWIWLQPPAGRLRFYLQQKLPLQMRCRAACPPTGGVVALALNGRPLKQISLGPEPGSFEVFLPETRLQEGENLLEFQGAVPSRWSRCDLQPQALGVNFEGSPPGRAWDPSQGELQLPFGQSLELPVRVEPGARIHLESLAPWLSSGAPQIEPEARPVLRLRLRSQDPALEQAWDWQPGSSLQFSVAVSQPQAAALSLLAQSSQAPKPGQLGLRLKGLELQSGAPAALPPAGDPPRGPAEKRKPPNIVVYLIDTLRPDHLGCYGYARNVSPCIDEFAREAVLFEQVQAQSCWTKTAVASLFTSLLPPQHGAFDFGDRLPEKVTTLAEQLRSHGYRTQGWTANVYVSDTFGFEQGFEHYDCLGGASSHQIHEKLVAWLNRSGQDERPFFLYIHTMDPHAPYNPPAPFRSVAGVIQDHELRDIPHQARQKPTEEAWKKRLSLAKVLYDDEIRCNDHAFGLLLQELKARKLYDNTMVVLLSDHGEEFLEHGYMGHINSLYQELLAVPWLLKLPGGAGAGTRVGELWQQIDLAPTLLHQAGIPIPEAMQGLAYSLSAPATPADRPAYSYVTAGQDALKFQQSDRPWSLESRSVRLGPWVYAETRSCLGGRLAPWELYDLQQDPQETENRFFLVPEQRARLAQILGRLGGPVSVEKVPPEDLQRHLRSLHYLR